MDKDIKEIVNSGIDDMREMTPDSLSGMIFALEGVRKSVTLLNGPTGCKFYHSITVDKQSLRKDAMDPLNYPEEWFFGQGRVPCTYLDKRDYVYGSEDKIRDAVKYILDRVECEAFFVVNSPGAALIGDDLERIVREALDDAGHADIPYLTFQSPGYSRDVSDGYKEACQRILEEFCGEVADAGKKRARGEETDADQRPANGEDASEAPSVNILGLSIYHKHHAGDIEELSRLLGLMGIHVGTALLSESSLDDIRAIGNAALNIVIDPEYGTESAEYLKEKYGTPYVSKDCYPVGFKAAEELISEVADALGVDPAPAFDDISKARATAYIHISRMSAVTGLPKGVPFMVTGSETMKRGYSVFLTDYLGMVDVSGRNDSQDGRSSSENKKDPEIVLSDGNTIAVMKAEGKRFSGIEISLPDIGYIDVMEKTHLGARGALLLIEQILNGLVY